jgi:hypothetical protein
MATRLAAAAESPPTKAAMKVHVHRTLLLSLVLGAWLWHAASVSAAAPVTSQKKLAWAYLFAKALQESRRPHIFNWGMGGHGTRTLIGANFDLDIRTDQSLPAFTACSLDDDIGDGDAKSGAPEGQLNAYLWWETKDLVDTPKQWALTALLLESAPKKECTVDLTPRRLQQFRAQPGQQLAWTNRSLAGGKVLQSGNVTADQWGLITIKDLIVTKGRSRLAIHN